MECQKAKDILLDYWDGALDPALRKNVEEHLSSCVSCAAELQKLRLIDEKLNECTGLEPSSNFEAGLSEKIDRYEETLEVKKKNWIVFLSTASLATAALVLFSVYFPFEPTQLFKPVPGSEKEFVVAAVKGEAYTGSHGEIALLEKGSKVRVKDVIETGSKSGVELQLAENSVLRIGANSRVVVAKNLEKGGGTEYGFKLEEGNVLCQVHKTGKFLKMEVETPNSIVSVKGTSFKVELDEKSATKVVVKEGVVRVGGLSGKKETVEVEAGNFAEVASGGTPVNKTFGEKEKLEAKEFEGLGKGFSREKSRNVPELLFQVHEVISVDPPKKFGKEGVKLAEGKTVGTLVKRTSSAIKLHSLNDSTDTYVPVWSGGNPNQGGGFDKKTLGMISRMEEGQTYVVSWYADDHLRITDIKRISNENTKKLVKLAK